MFATSLETPTPTPGSRSPVRWILVSALALLGGCAGSDSPSPSMQEQGREIFSPVTPGDDIDAATAWSIVIAAYRGEDRNARAQRDVANVQTQAGLVGAYVEDRGDATVIAYGRYESPDDRRAINDLQLVRETEYDNARPFAGAMLSPPSRVKSGSKPEWDLRNVKEMMGDWVIYSLQIGAYGVIDRRPSASELEEFRDAAEQAVYQLRREGEQAFYYHGPTMSMVLIGAWGDRDFEPSTSPMLPPRYEAPAIREAKRKFPYNLFNGQAIRDKGPSGQERLQPSHLVGVPEG